jgi:hypothetical protein
MHYRIVTQLAPAAPGSGGSLVAGILDTLKSARDWMNRQVTYVLVYVPLGATPEQINTITTDLKQDLKGPPRNSSALPDAAA